MRAALCSAARARPLTARLARRYTHGKLLSFRYNFRYEAAQKRKLMRKTGQKAPPAKRVRTAAGAWCEGTPLCNQLSCGRPICSSAASAAAEVQQLAQQQLAQAQAQAQQQHLPTTAQPMSQ